MKMTNAQDGRNSNNKNKTPDHKNAFSSLPQCFVSTKMKRTDAIAGAKIGHVANQINNDPTIMRQAEVIAIQAGSNMDWGSSSLYPCQSRRRKSR